MGIGKLKWILIFSQFKIYCRIVMNQNKIISSEQLLELLVTEGIDKSIYQKAEILQIAICDYPGSVQEPIDYQTILENEIGNPLTYNRISIYQSKLSLKDGNWKAESLSVILNIFDEDKRITLNDIINQITTFYYKNRLNKHSY